MKRTLLGSICIILLGFSIANVLYAQDAGDVNCAVLPDQIMGQANISYAGAANISYAGALGDEIETNTWDIEETTVLTDLQYATVGSDPVVIVVIDDFSTIDPREDASDDVIWANASHGWLVMEVIDRVLATLPTETSSLISVETLHLGGENAFRSDLIAEELETMLTNLNASGINKFVVNMSFVFVACEEGGFKHAEWMNRRADNPDLTLIEEVEGDPEYVETVLSDASVERMDENGFDVDNSKAGQGGPPEHVAQKLQFLSLFEISRMNSDPLRSFFMDKQQPYTVFPIASGGNFKWKRPFYPAQWPEVLSVSATLGDSPDLWALSNNSEISVPGAYFLFDDDVYRAGTSFAAPIASVMIAVDLTQSEPNCDIANNGRPEISSNGQWNDVPFLEAIADRC